MDVDAELVQFVKARPLDMNFGTGTGRSDLWVPSARLLTTQSNDPASENSSRDVSYNKQLPSTNAQNSKATSAVGVRRKASTDKIRNTPELRNSGAAFLAAPTSTTTTNNSNSNNIIMMTSNNNSSNSIALMRSDEDVPTSTSFGLSMLPTPIPAFTEVDERQEQQRQRTCDAQNKTTTTQITKSSAVRGNCLLSAALFHAHEDDSRSPTCISASSGHLMSFTSLSDGMAHSQKSTTATTTMTTTTLTTSNTQRNSNSSSGHRRRVALSELTRKSEATQSRRHTGLAKHSPANTSNSNASSGSGNNSRMVQGAQTRTPRQYVARNTRRTAPAVAQTERPTALTSPISSKAVNATLTTHPHSPPTRTTKSPSPTTPIASSSSAKRVTPRVTTATTTTTTSSSLSPVQAGYRILHDSGRCGGVAPQLTSAYTVECTTQAIPSVHLRRSPSTKDKSGNALHSLRSSPSLTRDARSPSVASGHSVTSDRPARKAETESEKRRTVYSVPRKQHCVVRDTGVQPTTTAVTVEHSSEVTPSVTTAAPATAVNDKGKAHIDGDIKEDNKIVLNTDAERSTPQPLSVPDGMSEALLNASPAASSGLYLKSATVTVSSMTSPTCANTASPAFTHSLDVGRLASTPELTAMPVGGVIVASTNTNGSYLYTAQGTATAGTTRVNTGLVRSDVDHNYHSSINNVISEDIVKQPGPGVALRDWSTPALAALLASDEVNECDEPVPRRLWPVHYDTSNSSSSREAGVNVSNTNRIGDAKKPSNGPKESNVNKSTVRPGSEKSSAQVAKPVDVALQPRETVTPVILKEDISKSIQTKTSSVPLSAIHTRTQERTTSAPASSSSTRLLPTMTSAQHHSDAQKSNTNANISSSISNRRATALDATPSPAKPPARLAPTNVTLDETASQHASRAPHDTMTSAAASYKATYSAFRAAVEALDQCHDEDAIPLSPPLRNTPKEDELLTGEGEEEGVGNVLVPQRKATARPAVEKAHWTVTTSPAAPFTSSAVPHGQDKTKNSFVVKEQYDKDHTAAVAMGRDEPRRRNTQKSVEDGHAGPWVPRLPLAELRVPDRDASPVPALSVLQPVRHEPSQSIQFSVHSDSATQASSEIRESLHDYEDNEMDMTNDLAGVVSPMMMMNGSGVVVDKEGDGVSMSARAAMTDPLSPVPLPQAQMPGCTSNVNGLRIYNGNKGKFTVTQSDGSVEEEAAVVAARRIRDMALNRFDDGTTNENARHAIGQRDISAAPLSSRQELTIVSISSLSSSTQGMALRHLAETGPRLSARGHLSARTADSPLGPTTTTTTNVATLSTNITNDDEGEFVARPIVPPLKWPPPNIAPASGSAIAGPQLPTYTIVPGTDYPPSLRTSNETSAVDVGESMSTMRPNTEIAAAVNGPDMSSGAAVGAAMSGPAQPPATGAAPYMNGNAKLSMKHSSGQCCSVM